MKIFKNKYGFSLLEVLIFISILSFVFIAAAYITGLSLRNLKSSENKIMATRYGEELVEWLRGEKETDWEDFTTKSQGTPSVQYCFSQEPISTWPSTGSCSVQLIDNLFSREASLLYDSGLDRVTVTVTVDWNEGVNDFTVPIKTVFSQFE